MPNEKTKTTFSIIIGIFCCLLACLVLFGAPELSSAAVYVGDETIEGYEPNDIIGTDMEISTSTPHEAADKLENTIVKLIKVIMPFLMIACVALIVFNAIRNLIYFNKKEKQISMGDLIKNMFVQFFFILFAFIIVEIIVFIVTGGESILFATIFS